MGCGVETVFVDEAVLNKPTLTRPEIVSGELVGSVEGDDAAWRSIAEGVAPHLPAAPLDGSAVAAVFKDKYGNALHPGSELVVGAQLDEALSAATAPAKIAGVLQNKAGNPLSPNTKVMSAEEVADAIELRVCQGCADEDDPRTITSFSWNQDKTALTITEGSGAEANHWTVDFTAFAKAPQATSSQSPIPGAEPSLPTRLFGGRTELLGRPSAWMGATINGVRYAVPLFQID